MALPAGRYGVTKEQLRKIKRLPINTIGMITETKEAIAIIEDGTNASQLITAGTQFWHNGKLYSADVDIAKDAAIITSGEGKNATEMPSVTSQIASGVESAYQLTKDSVGWTGKNLLNNTAVNKATSDLSFTVNADKSVTINGTATANRTLLINDNIDTATYAGCLINGLSGEGISFRITDAEYQTIHQEITANDTPLEDHGTGRSFYIRVAKDTVCNNVKVYPMLRRADIIDSTYEEYHATVDAQKADNSVIAPVENGTTASQAYAVNDVFIRDGALCKVTSAISQGDTLSNQFTETNVGAILTALLNA